MRVSTSLSDGEIVLLWEILTKLLSGSDPKLLVRNAHFPKLMQSIKRLKERADPDPAKRPPVKVRQKKESTNDTPPSAFPAVGYGPDPNVVR